jgi:hypothetical protein
MLGITPGILAEDNLRAAPCKLDYELCQLFDANSVPAADIEDAPIAFIARALAQTTSSI